MHIKDLKASYFTQSGIINAVDSVSLTLSKDQSLGIAGESGSGKSTLGYAIMRSMQEPGKIVSGTITVNGNEITKLSNSEFDRQIRWKKISMVFQGAMNALDPVYTVYDQMEEILREHKVKFEIEEKIYRSLEQVGLNRSVAKSYPHELSGGMKQRVIIAMALLLEPDIIIADEPSTALDVLVQSQIINLLKELKRTKNLTIIIITHDLAIISEIADTIAIMYAGQVVEFGSSYDILKSPKHPYTQGLISSIPSIRLHKSRIVSISGSPPDMLNPPDGCRFYDRCPHAMDICKKNPPDFKTQSGYVKCWLYQDSAY